MSGQMPGAEPEAPEPFEPIHMKNYVSTNIRRQLVKTMTVVIREYSYCSIACQLCIMVLDALKALFDVIDLVQLQKFVIVEFRERQLLQFEQMQKRKSEGGSAVGRRYQINHLNMQSAQVNQMTSQLKDKVQQIQEFYGEKNREMAIQITGSTLVYDDLISADDQEFWQYLCKKDFKRLNKLLTQNIGEGHFLGDGDTDEDSDEDMVMGRGRVDDSSDGAYEDVGGDPISQGLRARRQRANGEDDRNRSGSTLEDDGKEFDQDTFMEQMLLDMHQQQEDEEDKQKELEDQIKSQEDEEKRQEDLKVATYNDNQFWNDGVGDQYDIDDLMADMD